MDESQSTKPEPYEKLISFLQTNERKLIKSQIGDRSADAYRIALQVFLSKHPNVSLAQSIYPFQDQRYLAMLKRGEALLPYDKELILKAVQNADVDFLSDLVDLLRVSSGGQNLLNPVAAAVIFAHGDLMTEFASPPTIQQLSKAISDKDIAQVDRRTIRDVCKRYSLELSPSPVGRPKKQGSDSR